jgi:AraC-like DNA-binding protein
VDVLTDIFSTIRASSVVNARIDARAPWGIDLVVRGSIKFSLVVEGIAWLTRPGEAAVQLNPGDFVVTSHGSHYGLADHPATPQISAEEVFHGVQDREDRTVRTGGDGELTVLLNGKLEFDDSATEFLSRFVPPLLVVPRAVAERQGFALYLERLGAEAGDSQMGGQLIASWLGGILLIHSLRAYALSDEGLRRGGLVALEDPQLARALTVMHQDVGAAWTVESLAAEAGLSRSGFAARFQQKMGTSPLQYLTEWRLQLALQALRDPGTSLAELAGRIGYESYAAFSKAFRKRMGRPPSAWRRPSPGLVAVKELR